MIMIGNVNVNLKKTLVEDGEVNGKGYYLLRKPRRKVFYIIWKCKLGTVRDIRQIQAKIRQLVNGWYDLYEVQFSNDNRIAIRRFDRDREHNRVYKRNNPSFYICKDCGGLYNITDMTEKDTAEWYCEECYNEKFGICNSCEETCNVGDMRQDPNGNWLCEDCFYENWQVCGECNKIISNDESYNGTNDDGGTYCQNCWSDRFATCDNCGETVYQDDICYIEGDDQYYCPSCYEDIECGIIKVKTYKPNPIFDKEKYENTLYMGFELEIEVKGNTKDYAENLFDFLQKKELHKRYYFKKDGSLNNGFEIVSHPATLKKYHASHKIYDILQYLKKTDAESYDGKTCGLHIHINREFFTKKELGKLSLFFNNAENELIRFSQRTEKQIEGFCKYENLTEKGYIEYMSGNFEMLKGYDRYVAVNLTNTETIEFRIFRGTLDYKRFLASLMLIDALCNFIKETSYRSMNWQAFKNYLTFVNRYNHLEKYLKEKGL